MTKLLKKAFDEASKLPEKEHDALARILLEELASERRWEERQARRAYRLHPLGSRRALHRHQHTDE